MEENGNDDISTLPRLFAFANFVIYFSSFFARKKQNKKQTLTLSRMQLLEWSLSIFIRAAFMTKRKSCHFYGEGRFT